MRMVSELVRWGLCLSWPLFTNLLVLFNVNKANSKVSMKILELFLKDKTL